MEKKVRVKQLNHQDDIKRSWAAAYPLTEDFEYILSEDSEKVESKLDSFELDPIENNTPQVQPSVERHDADISEN